MFVAQGDSDELVHPPTTEAYVERLCSTHETVDFQIYEHIGHALIAYAAIPKVLSTFRAALEEKAPTTTC